MQATLHRFRFLCFFLAQVLLLEGICVHLTAQEKIKVKNARFEIIGTQVIVRYDLTASTGDLYRVRALLKKESDSLFTYVPRSLSGDIGDGEFAGNNRQINWDFLTDFPGGLEGDDFYFIVEVDLAPTKSNLIYYILGGAAVVAGGAAGLLLGKKTAGSTTAETPAGFPAPVGRPPVGL